MYNRYLDDGSFVLLDAEPQRQPDGHSAQHPGPGPGRRPDPRRPSRPPEPIRSKHDLLGEVSGALGQLLDGVKKHISLEHFDTGDILLVLIILFLYLEDGDNLELVITLGLLLLLGLGDEEARG